MKAGDIERGKAIFQTICATCHGFDGKLLDWGEEGRHAYVGTEAASLPDEVFNKILNSHPDVQMVNLRAFPVEDAAAVLARAATLPTECQRAGRQAVPRGKRRPSRVRLTHRTAR